MEHRTEPVPRFRRFSIDSGRLSRNKNIVHGLLEVDVSNARQLIRSHKSRTGEHPSFTAFIVNCLGEAIKKNDHLHAYMNWRRRLVIYDDINISAMIEVNRAGTLAPMPYVFKQVNRKDYWVIHRELRAAQNNPLETEAGKWSPVLIAMPWMVRRIVYWMINRVPQWFRARSSPVLVTAVGMFGDGSGWGIPNPSNTLTITLGGIERKPVVIEEEIIARDILNMTISFDHDIVDGAPAARFAYNFKELIEGCCGLDIEI